MKKRTSSKFDIGTELDAGLGGLFGALNEALGDMLTKLEDGASGTIERDHLFQTNKGPVRAHAGVRVRLGGLEAQSGPSEDPRPVNPDRPKKAALNEPRSIAYELIEGDAEVILTADLPGVGPDQVKLKLENGRLLISTTGQRKYATKVDLRSAVDLASIDKTMRNGILTLKIPKVPE